MSLAFAAFASHSPRPPAEHSAFGLDLPPLAPDRRLREIASCNYGTGGGGALPSCSSTAPPHAAAAPPLVPSPPDPLLPRLGGRPRTPTCYRPAGYGAHGARERLARSVGRMEPQGVAATREEAGIAYNDIDPCVALGLEERVKAFRARWEPDTPQEEATGVYLVVERCHSCEAHHGLTTRHREHHYSDAASDLLSHVRTAAGGSVLDVGELLCELGSQPRRVGNNFVHGAEVWHNASRVGAFEVYLLTPSGLETENTGPGTVVQWPVRSAIDVHGEEYADWKTWGAECLLPGCGYMATLLFSKLSSRSWPSTRQVLKRLYLRMPKAQLTVKVIDPSGAPLERFTVEAVEKVQEQQQAFDTAAADDDEGERVHMIVQGSDGLCRIEGVPTKSNLELRVYHSTMRLQSVEFAVTRLRATFVLGADIAFRLWAVDVPGGLVVCVSSFEAFRSTIHEKARPFEGQIEMPHGELRNTRGCVQLPWSTFSPMNTEPPQAFVSLKRIHAYGYYPADVDENVRQSTLRSLYHRDFFELATLAAPTVCIQVVLPVCRLPIPNVQVEVVNEQQRAQTNAKGLCWILLRFGTHVVRLAHPDIADGWMEQKIVVDAMVGKVRLTVAPQLKIWQSPVLARGAIYGYDLWLTRASGQYAESWEPFSGCLSVASGATLDVTVGILSIGQPCAEVLDETTDLRPQTANPIVGLAPSPPFARLLPHGVSGAEEGVGCDIAGALLGGADRGVQLEPRLLLPELSPLHLGASLLAPSGNAAASREGATSPWAVRALTACCGTGVKDLEVVAGAARGKTDRNGAFLPPSGLASTAVGGALRLAVRHSALGAEAVVHRVQLLPSSAGGGDEDSPVVVPVIFDAKFYLFCIPGPGGRVLVKAASSAAAVPSDAAAFTGRLFRSEDDGEPVPLDVGGCSSEEVSGSPRGCGCGAAAGTAASATGSPWRLVSLPVPAAGCGGDETSPPHCPSGDLLLEPNAPGYQWRPARPSPFSAGACGICQLLSEGTMVLGELHPFVTVKLFHGREISVLIEEHPKVKDVVEFVRGHLRELYGTTDGESEQEDQIYLVSEGFLHDSLSPGEVVTPGQQLCLLVRLTVRVLFGLTWVGVSQAQVTVNNQSQFTDGSGTCEFWLPAGFHSILVSHSLLGESCKRDVNLRSLCTTEAFGCVASVTPYVCEEHGMHRLDAPVAVWLSADPSHIPQNAIPLHGTAKIVGVDQQVREVAFEGIEMFAVDLRTAAAFGSDERDFMRRQAAIPAVPAAGVALSCELEGRVWSQATLPWLLDSQESWQALLQAPLRAGELRAPIQARCHAFGAERDGLVSLPASELATVGELCTALASRLCVGMEHMAVFADEAPIAQLEALKAWSVVDVWPTDCCRFVARSRCCGRGLQGVHVSMKETYRLDGSGEAVAPPGVMARGALVRVLPGALPDDGAGTLARVVRLEPGSRLCEVEIRTQAGQPAAAGPELASRREMLPCESLQLVDRCATGVTDSEGTCTIVTTAGGEHTMQLTHPIFEDSCDASDGCRDGCISRRVLLRFDPERSASSQPEELLVDPVVFVYMTREESASSDQPELQSFAVWLCASSSKIPFDEALPVPGTLRLRGDESEGDGISIGLGAVRAGIRLPAACRGVDAGSACPFSGLTFETDASGGLLWCPITTSSGSREGCSKLLAGPPVQLGTLMPAVTLHIAGATCGTLRLPLASHPTTGAARRRAAEELGVPLEELAVYPAGSEAGPPCDDGDALFAGMELAVCRLAALRICVLVPEGAQVGSSCTSHGLKDVEVEVDGQPRGVTDEEGSRELLERAGDRVVRLRHSCFGEQPREVVVTVVPGHRTERHVIADIRLHIFASRADDDHDDESGDQGPVLLWICGTADQTQGDIVPIEGRVWATGPDGEVSQPLGKTVTELVLYSVNASGTEAEAEEDDAACRCSLASLGVEAAKAGFCWRPRHPPPLVERAEEIGGCEYLRLLACPTVIGYLDPAFRVTIGDSSAPCAPALWLPARQYGTVALARAHLSEALDLPEHSLWLARDGLATEPLPDDAPLVAGATVALLETAEVRLRVISGCCGSAVDGISISVNGLERGITDADGALEVFRLPVGGGHVAHLQHAALVDASLYSVQLHVSGRQVNELVVTLAPRLLCYATELEAEEEADEETGAAAVCEPICVWLAADPAHIDDEALPLSGTLAYKSSAGEEVKLDLAPGKIEPVFVRPEGENQTEPLVSERCALASLALDCTKRGYVWEPKDPSPLLERAAEIGGCELLRLLVCPVSLGFLKPAVTVQCSSGLRIKAPLDTFEDPALLRGHVAARLGGEVEEEQIVLTQSAAEAPPLEDGKNIAPRTFLLCPLPGEDIDLAREHESRADSAEAQADEAARAAAAARAARDAELGALRCWPRGAGVFDGAG
eukprot:TRINITY_DN1284_c0_g3_i1.p1 TRINITY_DN1284_c0_g3~~TRINITY_DN1284_c0_g3_i1.p1  ORF type:complete len:2408 (-),score=404.08 TRINITY_DN1284_c0_g3_i1:117-7340(-)